MSVENKEILPAQQISEGKFLELILQVETVWMDRLKRVIDKLQHLNNIRNRYFEAKDSGLRVKAFMDEKENFWFEIESKDQAGFKTS